MIAELLLTLLVLAAAYWLHRKYNYRNFPPGPRGWPLVGYLPCMGPRPHETFLKLTEKYGSVFGLTLGLKRVVVLGNWRAVEEALVRQGDVFAGRPDMFCFDSVVKKRDVATTDGPMWKEQRKSMSQTLKRMGYGCSTFENTLGHSVNHLVETLNQHVGRHLHLEEYFFEAIMNITWKITGNKTYMEGDSKAANFLAMAKENFLGFRNNQPLNFMPYLRYLVPGAFGYWRYVDSFRHLWAFLKEEVREHLATYVPGDCRDFIDCHIEQMLKNGNIKEAPPPYNVPHITGSIYDLFLGGTDSSVNTLQWGLVYLLHNPDIQDKIQEELDRIVGPGRSPSLSDKPALPYLEAFTMEVHRFASLVPLSLMHAPMRDTELFGYRIPKGTIVLQNIHGVHFDPKMWDHPERFDPGRFLDESNEIIKCPHLIPFSLGRRFCPGEPIARLALFIIFATLLHRFHFSNPPGTPLPSMDPDVGLVLSPKSFPVQIHLRR